MIWLLVSHFAAYLYGRSRGYRDGHNHTRDAICRAFAKSASGAK